MRLFAGPRRDEVAAFGIPAWPPCSASFIPGVGQIYNGDFIRGIFWLVVTPGLWIGSGGLLGWICHVVAAYTAHRRAKDKNAGLA